MELLNQMDGFDSLGRVKIIMATNRPDTLDPALLRPGRLDRKIEIGLPNEQSRLEVGFFTSLLRVIPQQHDCFFCRIYIFFILDSRNVLGAGVALRWWLLIYNRLLIFTSSYFMIVLYIKNEVECAQ